MQKLSKTYFLYIINMVVPMLAYLYQVGKGISGDSRDLKKGCDSLLTKFSRRKEYETDESTNDNSSRER